MKLLVLLVLCSASIASADPTAHYLDHRAVAWIKSPPPIANVACAISCHTTLPYLLARRHLGTPLPEIRAAFEARLPSMIARTATPYYGEPNTRRARQSHSTEAVLTAVALLMDDRAAGESPTKTTRTAIDHAWSMQRRDGGFDWLDFDIEPWESSEDWGNAMAVSLVAHAPTSDHRERLFGFLRKRLGSERLPMRLHDRATLLWISRGTDLLDARRQTAIADALVRTQQKDGGFAMRTIDRGTVATTSDAYATALGVLALCGDSKRIKEVGRGLAWLREHRADDGSYPARSKDHGTVRARGYATDAATAYATLAIATCGQ
jgi:hypothetical protein